MDNLFQSYVIACSCLNFIMGLTKLRILQLKLTVAGYHSIWIRADKLTQLQEHSSLQEVHLLGRAAKYSLYGFSAAADVPLIQRPSSFFGIQQLKVLSLTYDDYHVEVASCPVPHPYSLSASRATSCHVNPVPTTACLLCVIQPVTAIFQTQSLSIAKTAALLPGSEHICTRSP